ncbi:MULTISPECIES: hypothetical protein [Roseomonadaceae]|uniref:Uncharacterized protein n=1 Tax=Falsiroseomonas oleicola TaxID=2801474 RepID=A0ABS6H7V0_9PROT|nr:hypothetical protein [Roseomonas oleicola]MBU8544774.1 hypothetical protein [Roseomonas oleicola]
MSHIRIAAALAAGVLLPGLAAARPADCLVQIEGRTLVNGTCDFEAEPSGDFTVTLGSRTARVMVDPDGRLGRASYEDSASGEPPGVADVQRDGACWGRPNVIRVCAWAVGARPAAYQSLPAAEGAPTAPAGAPASGAAPVGLRVVSSRAVGPWTLSRLEGAGSWRCEVERHYPDGGTLAFLAGKPSPGNQNIADTGLRFGAAALSGMRGEIRVLPWGSGPEYTQTAIADGNGSATLMDPPNEPGSSDAFANGREFEVSLPGGVRLRYPLNGSSAAWRALAQCAGF